MREYVTTSLETHLFFGRIMKEHALFLQAGFPAGETGYRKKTDWYREEFEKILWQTVRIADGMVGEDVLRSGEVFTEFTVMAERQTAELTKALLKDESPAYIRVGRNAVDPVYEEGNVPFEMDKATVIGEGNDALSVACGEMTYPAAEAVRLLEKDGIHATVLDMYCVKPLDKETLLKYAAESKVIVTAEEHAPFGGLGSMVSQAVAAECPRRVINIALPDAPVISGTSKEVFDYYGMNAEGIARTVKNALA